MKILFLTQLLPFPTDNGGKIKTLSTLTALKNLEHEINLACFVDQKKHLKYQKNLKPFCYKTKAFFHPVVTRSHKQLIGKAILSLFSPEPFAVFKYYSPLMKDYLMEISRKTKFDAIYIDHLHLAQYLRFLESTPLLIYDEHNISSLAAWRNFQTETNLAGKLAYLLEAFKWHYYEKKFIPLFDKILTISSMDRQRLISRFRIPDKDIAVLPIAIKSKPYFKFKPKTANILFIGLMSWKPNRDAFWWFYQQIFPLVKQKIPDVRFTVIGANPSRQMIRISSKDKSLNMLGYVRDINKYLKSASVFVVPIKSGGGIRIKILVALAAGLPVVSTKIGTEGIPVKHNKQILIADEAGSFAQGVIKLIQNEKLATCLSKNGLKFIKENYNQKKLDKLMLSILHSYNLI